MNTFRMASGTSLRKHASYLMISLAVLLSACNPPSKPLVYQVKKQDFAIIIPAQGALEAAQATTINTPTAGRFGKAIAWLAPEYSLVKKDQVIATFDGEAMLIQSQARRNEIASKQQDVKNKEGELTQQQSAMREDIDLVVKEKRFADKFTIDDIRILSKLEILDSLQNSEYLGTKEAYLLWTQDKFSTKAEGERALTELELGQVEARLQLLTDNLAQLEIKAPHDGMLVYHRNFNGEQPRVGEVTWPGQKIAELPNINNMQLKLQVAENEAINLAAGQTVSFTLNANATQQFTGTISQVAPFAKTIEMGNPLKFFEVIVALKNQQPLFSPGKKVQALIEVQASSPQLIVPRQSVFSENNQSHVYLYQAQSELSPPFIKVPVTLGTNSLSHVEILSGLHAGQEISLTPQEIN